MRQVSTHPARRVRLARRARARARGGRRAGGGAGERRAPTRQGHDAQPVPRRGPQPGDRGARLPAPLPSCTLGANQSIWNTVVATDFPARAKVLAKEIDEQRADDRRPAGGRALAQRPGQRRQGRDDRSSTTSSRCCSRAAARGDDYKVAVVQQEADIESPAGDAAVPAGRARTGACTMRDVILVRNDLPTSIVSYSNPQSANYANAHRRRRAGSTYGRHRVQARLDVDRRQAERPPTTRFVEHAPRVGLERLPRRRRRLELVGASAPARCYDASRRSSPAT